MQGRYAADVHRSTPTPTPTPTPTLSQDINSDGVISLEEFTAWYLRSEERMKYELDTAWNKMAGDGGPCHCP